VGGGVSLGRGFSLRDTRFICPTWTRGYFSPPPYLSILFLTGAFTFPWIDVLTFDPISFRFLSLFLNRDQLLSRPAQPRSLVIRSCWPLPLSAALVSCLDQFRSFFFPLSLEFSCGPFPIRYGMSSQRIFISFYAPLGRDPARGHPFIFPLATILLPPTHSFNRTILLVDSSFYPSFPHATSDTSPGPGVRAKHQASLDLVSSRCEPCAGPPSRSALASPCLL